MPSESTIDAFDRAMMERCIALAIQAVDVGEYPYAAVICRDGEGFRGNQLGAPGSRRHASCQSRRHEAGSNISRLNQVSLEDCTIYTNAEPCALCCYAMRETRIGRVVFGVPAPLTGGLSRWNILADVELSNTLPEVFAPPPEIVPGFMHEQVEAAMARRTPITWEFIRARNIFGGPLPAHLLEKLPLKRKDSFQERLMSFLRRQLFDYLRK